MKYNYTDIEKKWQKKWEDDGIFHAVTGSDKPKYYTLVEFPYPSGAGLHVGHPRGYTAMDIVSRKRRMEGYNVLFPIGWDAFGLPTENYALKTGIHPRVATDANIKHFTEQLKALGFSFDWTREIDTTNSRYFKWTQWIFLKLFEKGLAYKSKALVNFCPTCKVVLANEESQGGVCDRCGSQVIQKEKEQWMLKITAYAQKLLDGLEDVDYLPRIKMEQTNWIGRSEGAEIDFNIADTDKKLRVFTTRCDTLFGATFMVISPEHQLVEDMKDRLTNYDEVLAYKNEAAKKSEFERKMQTKEKTGVELKGIRAINPATGNEIPVYISDYVLSTYGTGAIMCVPAHDTRDWEFANKFGIPMVEVIAGGDITKEAYTDIENGILVNSEFLNGLTVKQAQEKMFRFLGEKGIGEKKVNFNMHDWVYARQRYWGEPVPIIHCPHCGMVQVPYDQLPLELPVLDDFRQSDSGESPLVNAHDWVNTTCPKCGAAAKRETDTMPQWAGSSWYFLRYIDPMNDEALASEEALNYWLPVDWYNGGMEHVTRHMIYSRFWHRFLYDIGVVPTKEPYAKRTAHGLILGADGQKMSKSRGNVVNPDDIVRDYGADTLRTYEMFIGDFEKPAPWSDDSVKGCKRFLERVYNLQDMLIEGNDIRDDIASAFHKTIKKVGEDIEAMKFNTAIAALMALINDIYAKGSITKGELGVFVRLLCPIAPHIAEEIWQSIGGKGYASLAEWPKYDEAKLVDATVEIPVQVLGKMKGKIIVPMDSEEAFVVEAAKAEVADKLDGKSIVKVIYVKNKILNLIVK